MRPFKYIALLGIAGAALTGCSEIDPVIADLQLPDSQPFIRNADNYSYYRIPAIVITKHDNVLAFAEGRVDGREDGGNIDIVLRRSGDRGRTWQDLLVVFDDGTATCHNPCPIYLPEQNRVVMIMNKNYSDSRIYVTYSDNEGQTWETPREITNDVRPNGFKRFTQGPCHGIVKQREPNKGRLVISGYMRSSNDSPYYANSIYSDDNGETWHYGGATPTPNTNESTLCELSDGSLLMSIRMTDGIGYRGPSISRDGGLTWSEATIVDALPDPGCQGSIYTYSYGGGKNGKNVLLFCNPAWQERRWHNTIRASFDDGTTWSKGVDYTGEEVGGYSDIACFSDGEIALLSEYGYLNEGGIIFRKFKLDDIK